MIIAVVNQKGGVGKSTISGHLAVWLHGQSGSTALIDSDAQNSTSQWVKEAAPDLPIFKLPSADDILEQTPTIAQKFKYVVMDGPASLADATRSILFMADLALIPCGPTALDLRATDAAIRVLKQVQNLRKGPPQSYFVPCKVRQYRLSREFLEIAKTLGISVTSALRLREAIADAPGQGTVVWKMGKKAIDATNEFQQLFREVLSHDTATSETEPTGSNGGNDGASAGGT